MTDFTREPERFELGAYRMEVRRPLESDVDPVDMERLQILAQDSAGRAYYADFITLEYVPG